MMDFKTILTKLISRFRADEICKALEDWGYLDKNDINEIRSAGSKQQMVAETSERCLDRQVDEEMIGELDLLHMNIHSKKKAWRVHQMLDPRADKSTSLNPMTVHKKLTRRLDHYFDSIVSTKVLDKALWIRMSLAQLVPMRSRSTNMITEVVYMLHYPRTNFIISTPIKVAFKESVLASVVWALGFTTSKEMQLTGHCVKSLAEITLNRKSQGGFRKHRPNGDHVDPLLLRPQRKRKEHEEELDDRVTREDEAKRRKTAEILQRMFGPYEQPVLEKIEFKLETHFRGFKPVRSRGLGMNTTKLDDFLPLFERQYSRDVEPKAFRCTVKFEGKNTLEGLRSLGKRGLVSVPLPRHLACVPSEAKNYFVLGEKTRPPRNLRSPAPA